MEKNRILVDFAQKGANIKPLHSVNNGPCQSRGSSNAPYFSEAGFPYARLHDSAFCASYGGPHIVDIIAIFPDFSADADDPSNYDFTLTDEYLQAILAVGTKVFYRLGSKIEHESKKYGTRVPADYLKWAQICEHIIRHYNEGWADGFRMGIEYWEIWNEPDCWQPDGSNPCWQGTDEQFCDFFYVALKHLKKCFPDLKIGGPAFCSVNVPFTEKLLSRLTADGERVPLDFYSYHGYDSQPGRYASSPGKARELLDRYGYRDTELILNEWNYVRHWRPADEIQYAYKTIRSMKGASFALAVMCVLQDTVLDQLMYYDARPCSWCGLFDQLTLAPMKPYYAFKMFQEAYRAGVEAYTEKEGEIFGCAACGENEMVVILTRYTDADEEAQEDTAILLKNLPDKALIEYYLLDDGHNLSPFRKDMVTGGTFSTAFPMKLFDCILIKITPTDASCCF